VSKPPLIRSFRTSIGSKIVVSQARVIDRTQIIFGKKTVHELESLSSEASYFKSNFVEIKKKSTKKLNMIIKEKKSIIIVITKKNQI
jgi:hypothetical protein